MGKKSKVQMAEDAVSRDKAVIETVMKGARREVLKVYGDGLKRQPVELETRVYEYLLAAFLNHEAGMRDKGMPLPENLKEHNVRDRIKGKGNDMQAAYTPCKRCQLRSRERNAQGFYECVYLRDMVDGNVYGHCVSEYDGCSWGIPMPD